MIIEISIKKIKGCNTKILLNNKSILPIKKNDLEDTYMIDLELGRYSITLLHFFGADPQIFSAIGKTNFPIVFSGNPKNNILNHIITWSNDLYSCIATYEIKVKNDASLNVIFKKVPYTNFLNVEGSQVSPVIEDFKNIKLIGATSKINWTYKQIKHFYLMQLIKFIFLYGSIGIVLFYLIIGYISNGNQEIYAKHMTGYEMMLLTLPFCLLFIVNMIRYFIILVIEYHQKISDNNEVGS